MISEEHADFMIINYKGVLNLFKKVEGTNGVKANDFCQSIRALKHHRKEVNIDNVYKELLTKARPWSEVSTKDPDFLRAFIYYTNHEELSKREKVFVRNRMNEWKTLH
jgi:hypothetical protein